MPTNTDTPVAPATTDSHAHGEIDCIDAEALLADALAENSRLRSELDLVNRRFEIVAAQKNLAIDEAVAARSL